MSSNLESGLETFGFLSEAEPEEPTSNTETQEEVAQESVETQAEPVIDQGSEGEEAEEAVVFNKPNDFVKYEYDEESDLYTFNSNGRKVSVDKINLIAHFQKGENYEAKMKEIASQKDGKFDEAKQKEIDAVVQAAEKYRELTGQLEKLVKDSEESIDWEGLRETDTPEYLRQKELQEQRKQALEKAKKDNEDAQDERRKTLISQEVSKLKGALKLDDQELVKAADTMQEYASTLGFSENEISQLIDHRFWLVVNDAMKYQELKSKKFEEEKPKPENNKSPRVQKSEQLQDYELFYGKGS